MMIEETILSLAQHAASILLWVGMGVSWFFVFKLWAKKKEQK